MDHQGIGPTRTSSCLLEGAVARAGVNTLKWLGVSRGLRSGEQVEEVVGSAAHRTKVSSSAANFWRSTRSRSARPRSPRWRKCAITGSTDGTRNWPRRASEPMRG